jgi:hypothetical protein
MNATTPEVQGHLTPYGAAKLVNAVLEQAELPPIPPQMLYNYTTNRVNKGKQPLIQYDVETGVDREDLERWTKEYIVKKRNGSVSHAPLDIDVDALGASEEVEEADEPAEA